MIKNILPDPAKFDRVLPPNLATLLPLFFFFCVFISAKRSCALHKKIYVLNPCPNDQSIQVRQITRLLNTIPAISICWLKKQKPYGYIVHYTSQPTFFHQTIKFKSINSSLWKYLLQGSTGFVGHGGGCKWVLWAVTMLLWLARSTPLPKKLKAQRGRISPGRFRRI